MYENHQQNHRMLQLSLEILQYVSSAGKAITFTEICSHFAIPKSTTHNLLHTMTSMNYLQKDTENGRYSIGLKCFEVGNAYLATNPFYTRAKEIVESISLTCNETTHFAILDGSDVVYLYKFDSMQPLRVFSHIGKRVPAHATAIGKAILSGLGKNDLLALYPEEELPMMTPHTISARTQLFKQLDEIKIAGVAFEKEESTPFVQCIGVPIFTKQHSPIAGMSISIPILRASDDMHYLVDLLVEGKKQLESLLI